jgi:hypothetical protein
MKYKIISSGIYIVLIVVVLAASDRQAMAASWETSGFRTLSGALIRVGMSKADVRRDAGEPLAHDRIKRTKSAGGKKTKRKKKPGEAWTYRGNDGYYTVRFSGDSVSSIDVVPDRF